LILLFIFFQQWALPAFAIGIFLAAAADADAG
jgi:hypothetical protein